MKSFGIWYKLTEEKEKELFGKNDEHNKQINENDKLNVEMHVNLWSKIQSKGSKKSKETFLDIGLKITNYKQLDNLFFVCPFDLQSNDLIDLSDKLNDKKNANLIFNNECEIETKGNYTIINNNENNERLLVYPLYQSLEDVVKITPLCECNSKIDISFKKFKNYIEDKSVEERLSSLKDLSTVYIRFRIKSANLKNMLFYNVDPMNKYFESGFISTQIIDFKINNKRNIDENILAKAIINKEHLVKFKKIHFLLMEPASNDVIDISNVMSNCRKLESDVWDDYLDDTIDTDNILVYHWKEKCEDDCIEEFGKLVKINYSKTDNSIIFNYISIVLLLSVISGLISSSIFGLINYPSEGIRTKFDIIFIIIYVLTNAFGFIYFKWKK